MILILDLLSAMIELLTLNCFFDLTLNKKTFKKFQRFIIYFLIVLSFILISIFITNNIFGFILYLVLIFSFIFIQYKGRFIKFFILSIISFLAINFLVVVVIKLISDHSMSIINISDENLYVYFEGNIIAKLILYASIKNVQFLLQRKEYSIKLFTHIIGLTFPTIVIISSIYIVVLENQIDSSYIKISSVVIMFLLATSVIGIFNFLENNIKCSIAQKKLNEQEFIYELQRENYKKIKDNIINTNKNNHDVNNFMIGVSSYIHKDEKDKAITLIDDFIKNKRKYTNYNYGNDAVNALLAYKMPKLDKINNLSISISVPNQLIIDEIDLCVIIGNAIDNAVEACDKIENSQDKYIKIKIQQLHNYLSMLFENSYIETNTKLITSKKDKYLHGYGLNNMKLLCKKHNGDLVTKQSKNIFAVSIMIPN